jgi:hypothetical protein
MPYPENLKTATDVEVSGSTSIPCTLRCAHWHMVWSLWCAILYRSEFKPKWATATNRPEPAWSKKAQNNVRIGVWACRCVLGFPQQEKHETFAICDLDLLTVFAAELAVETGAARCCLVPATQVAVRVAVCRLVQLERP